MDRRPEEVPHHPRVLAVGMIATAIALTVMVGWFWSVNTGQGLILTAEQQRAAEIAAEQQAAAESAAEQDKTQADLEREAEARAAQGKGGKAKGGPPPAPPVSDTVTDEVELATYSILAVNGVLNVGGELGNLTSSPVSGTVRAYVYIDGVPVATARTEVSGLKPGATTKVNMVSDSDYQPGEKVILLEFEPRR